MKKLLIGAIAFGVMIGSAAISSAGNPLGPCKACHFFDKGPEVKKNNLGPGLKGVVGRKISIEGVGALGDTWTEAALDTWLTNPGAVKKGTKMTFKQKKEKKRAKIIEALKGL
ncbi:MAG: cytochrome c family protein [Nitrospinae bacterium]|nr:cytochrome c family protein [Nitrospinota bacterium]